jgi:hypothetical protein
MTQTEALTALHTLTHGDLYDANYGGGTWMVRATFTTETLAEFALASDRYAKCSVPSRGTIAGLPCLSFEEVQVRRGDARQPLSVIDLGDVRVAVADDLNAWMVRER